MDVINPSSLAAPRGYSHGVVLGPGRLLFIAGQVGSDQDGRLVDGGFVEQFDRALANILTVVTAAGGRPEAIGRFVIYVTDMREYLSVLKEVGEAYRRHMGRHYPAMCLIEVKGLVDPRARVEIEGVAVV